MSVAWLDEMEDVQFLWAFIWFLFFGVGILVYEWGYWCILVYFAYYLSKEDRFVYILVEDKGMV
jgi:hypothetical protein